MCSSGKTIRALRDKKKNSWVNKLLDPLHHAGWKSLFLDKVGNLGGDFWMFSKPSLGTDHLT
jgi:hypothetical protein